MESCLAAQKRSLLFKEPGSKLKIWRKCRVLQAYRLIPLTRPLSGHFTFGIIIFVKLIEIVIMPLLDWGWGWVRVPECKDGLESLFNND